MIQSDPNALGNDGWLVYGNVFGLDWTWWYGYGPNPAPNNPGAPAFSLIAAGQGGPAQGAQQVVVFSDYNNGDHPNAYIESNFYQEQMIGVADVGQTWVFMFDAKLGDLAGGSTALAFIKTLDPAAGYAMTNFITEDMTTTPTTWTGYSISITIDSGLVDQILQFGFSNIATNYEPSGVYYDNVTFQSPISVEDSSWASVKALYR
jgi:hypothetical protein